MKFDKRKKIMAMLNNPASTKNEKEICRKLLAKHPEDKPPKVEWSDAQNAQFNGLFGGARSGQQAASPLSGMFDFRQPQEFPHNMNQAAAQQREAAAQQDALRNEYQFRQAQAAQRAAYNRHTGKANRQRPTPKVNYTPEDFVNAKADMDQQLKEMNEKVKQEMEQMKNKVVDSFMDTLKRAMGIKK